jgi:hypothetical protein
MMRCAFAWGCLFAAISCSESAPSATSNEVGTPSGVVLSGILYESRQDGNKLLAGAEVCVETPAQCAMSDDGGRFVLEGLEPEHEILLTFSKSAYVPTLLALVTPRWSSTLGVLFLTPEANVPSLNASLRDAGRTDLAPEGELLSWVPFSAVGGLTSEVRVRLEPDPGSQPFFILDTGELALEIPADRSASFGQFVEVPPREDYELVYEADGGACDYYPSALGGWPPSSGRSNATRIPVREGFMTYPSLQECSLDRSAQ